MVYPQHVPFEGVVDIDIIRMAAESVASKQGDWKVGVASRGVWGKGMGRRGETPLKSG